MDVKKTMQPVSLLLNETKADMKCICWLFDLGIYVPPTAKVIWGQALVYSLFRLKKPLTEHATQHYKASDMTTAPWRLL